jgi:hypothetical protein
METQTKEQTELRVSGERMAKIEDLANQWMTMEEHWTSNNMNRYQQLEQAIYLHAAIKREFRKIQEENPNYAELVC